MSSLSRPLKVLAFRLGAQVPTVPLGRSPLWVHGASLGEVAAAISLLSVSGTDGVYLTSGTPEGLSRAEASGYRGRCGAGPLERHGTRRLLRSVRPRALWLVESELWPGVLAAARREDVPVAVVGARLSERSFRRYLRPVIKGRFQKMTEPVSLFAAADASTALRLTELGVPEERIRVCGRIKVPPLPDAGAPLPRLMEALSPGRSWLVGGCTHDGEEEALLEMGGAPLLLAPRHLERLPEVEALVRRRGLEPVRRSEEPGSLGPGQVLVLDTLGELAHAYSAARYSFVGGSLTGAQAHDLLEPLAGGSHLISGPRWGLQAEEARMLRRAGALTPFDGSLPPADSVDVDAAALLEQLDGRPATLAFLRERGLA